MRLRDGALTLASHVRYAEALAVDRERPTRIVIDRKGHSYRVEMAATLTGTEFVRAPGVVSEAVSLPEGVRFHAVYSGVDSRGGSDVFEFWPRGLWSRGRVVLTDGQASYEVRVSGVLGRVEVIPVEAAVSEDRD
jgi:hypothetical protein